MQPFYLAPRVLVIKLRPRPVSLQAAVLVEIYRERDPSGRMRYVLLETASATGNRLLRFTSADPSLVARLLVEEIGGIWGFEEASIRIFR